MSSKFQSVKKGNMNPPSKKKQKQWHQKKEVEQSDEDSSEEIFYDACSEFQSTVGKDPLGCKFSEFYLKYHELSTSGPELDCKELAKLKNTCIGKILAARIPPMVKELRNEEWEYVALHKITKEFLKKKPSQKKEDNNSQSMGAISKSVAKAKTADEEFSRENSKAAVMEIMLCLQELIDDLEEQIPKEKLVLKLGANVERELEKVAIKLKIKESSKG